MVPAQRPPVPRIGVLLVENRAESRNRLASYVGALPEFALVGEASEVSTALRLLGDHKLQVVVLNWALQGTLGPDFFRALRLESAPELLVVSSSTSDEAVRDALAAGARGFIEESASFADFGTALRAVAEGRAYFGPAAAQAMRRIVTRTDRIDPDSGLSARERQVLRLIAEGLSSKGIAGQLGISARTVEKHRASIGMRTGLRSIAQLTLFALRLGLIDQPESSPFGTRPQDSEGNRVRESVPV